jgi:predicted acyltransferase
LEAAVQSSPTPAPEFIRQAPPRNLAIDAYRGFVMLLMTAEVLELSRVAQAFPASRVWAFLAYHQTHVDWAGCSLHDTIQPGFSFLVGVALPYSIASRIAKGVPFGRMFGHALWRSLLLVALGILLRSLHSSQTNITFEDTLAQIGLGYPFLFLLAFRPPKWQAIALAAILVGYWLAWALYPVPGPGFDFQSVGVPPTWRHFYGGFAVHWNKNANLGSAFDQWFLNLFPFTKPFVFNGGGYVTLSFIPTLGTMILGLLAGQWLRAAAPRIPMLRLLAAGAIGISAGLLLHFTGICPVVKRIWTPSWTLFSGGICLVFLAGFCWILDVRGHRKWAFPLIVIGMNSIAAYLMAELCGRFVVDFLSAGPSLRLFQALGTGVEPILRGTAVLLVYWLVLLWMYWRKIFLRV